MLDDASANWGYGASLDCQQGLSPLYARPGNVSPSGEMPAVDAYKAIQVPVAMWYGKQDSTVPIYTAEWLAQLIEKSDLRLRNGNHGLYFQYTEEIIDDLIEKMRR